MWICLLATPALARAQTVTTLRVLRTTTVLEEPQGSAAVVATVNTGDVLEVLDQRNGWYLVRPPAQSTLSWKTGWINSTSAELLPQGGQPAPGQPAPAQAKTRKGFIIGLGGGIGMHSAPTYTYTYSYSYPYGYPSSTPSTSSARIHTRAFLTDFKVGYAPTSQILIYYDNHVAWTQNEQYDILGMSGGGVTYAFSPTSPSLLVKGAVGAAVGATVDLGNGTVGSSNTGTGFSVGGGYEFARHWTVEGSVLFLRLGQNNNHTIFSATVNWLFY